MLNVQSGRNISPTDEQIEKVTRPIIENEKIQQMMQNLNKEINVKQELNKFIVRSINEEK